MEFVVPSYTSVASYYTCGVVAPCSQSSKAFLWSFPVVYGRQLCFPSCYAAINNISHLPHLLKTISPSLWRGCFNNLHLRNWSRETGSAVPSRASLLIFRTLAESLVLTQGVSSDFRSGILLFIPPTVSTAQSRVYQATQLRTDGVYCRESVGTGPVALPHSTLLVCNGHDMYV